MKEVCDMRMRIVKQVSIMISVCACLCFVHSGVVEGWTFRADFENGTVGQLAQGTSGLSAALPMSKYSTEIARSGNKSAKVDFVQGSTGSPGSGMGTGGVVTYPARVYEGGEVWGRAYYYFSTPWSWTCSPVVKMLRGARVASSSGGHLGYHSVFAGSTGAILLSNEVGGTQPNSGVTWDVGKWQCIEMYVKLHHDPAQAIFRIWKNGQLIIENRTRTLQNSSDYADFGYIFTYWNGGHPQNQIAYIDDVIFTNETPANRDSHGNPMIGCGGGTNPPGVLRIVN